MSTDLPTPEALFARWRRDRDPAALGALFDAAAPGLFRLALSLVPDAATAEDALQETFLFAMEEDDRWDPARPVVPWLAGILRLKVLEVRRRHARAPRPERMRRPPDPEDPLARAADAEERERVRLALLALEEPYREASLLRWRYGLEPAEIAEVKGVPPGTVSSWLHRAVEKLRVEMGALPAVMAAAFPEKGLALVKAKVLEGAAAKVIAGSGAAVAAAGGGIVAGKVAIGVAAVGLAAFLGWWTVGRGGDAGTGPGTAGSPTTAGAPGGTGAGSPGGSGGGTDPSSSSASATNPSRAPGSDGAAGMGTGGVTEGTAAPATGAPAQGGAPPGSGTGPKEVDAPSGSSTPTAYSPALATATLRFRAKAAGTLPRMRNIKFDADPKCGEQHKQSVPEQTLVTDADGNLANVIAWVSRGSERWTYTPATESALVDQKGCMYLPHVLTVRVHQPVAIRNSDPCMHNIHAVPKVNAEFNKSQLKGAADLIERFTREEVAVKMKCDVHGWMGAWVGVFAHPFHGVTGADGTVVVRVPPGEYEVSGWHEYGKFEKPAAQTVTVAEGETKEIDFVFEAR